MATLMGTRGSVEPLLLFFFTANTVACGLGFLGEAVLLFGNLHDSAAIATAGLSRAACATKTVVRNVHH